MKIQIETEILGISNEVSELNYIIHLALAHTSLKDFAKDIKQTEFFTLKYGFGSSHCWVKQFTFDGSLRDERILFITETK